MSFWVKLAIIVGIVVAVFSWHSYDKHVAVQAGKNQVRLEYSLKLETARHEKDALEASLRDKQKKALEEKNEKIKDISRRLDSVLSSLQHYKSCSELTGQSASITAPCRSRELSREDGEFLAREAAKAQSVVEERDYYYGRYEDARKSLEPR